MGGIVGNLDLRMKTPDGRDISIPYKAVFNHSYHTRENGTKELRCIAYFVLFPAPSSHPSPAKARKVRK